LRVAAYSLRYTIHSCIDHHAEQANEGDGLEKIDNDTPELVRPDFQAL